jgi:hypothetical protein
MLTLAQFAPLQGQHFELRAEGRAAAALALVEAQALTAHPGALRAPFSLVFEGPAEPLLPQATYGLAHPVLGALDIFLVPVARGPAGIRYEAVFN